MLLRASRPYPAKLAVGPIQYPCTLRDECLNEHLFSNLKEACQIIEAWRIDYNTNRPHTSLGGLTLAEFATRPAQGHNRNRLYL